MTVMGMTLIILHAKEMCHDMLDQMSSKTSGRPSMTMANNLCGYGMIVICQTYDAMFRKCRKFLHRELGTKASSATFRGAQETEVKRQLLRTLTKPEKITEHYKK